MKARYTCFLNELPHFQSTAEVITVIAVLKILNQNVYAVFFRRFAKLTTEAEVFTDEFVLCISVQIDTVNRDMGNSEHCTGFDGMMDRLHIGRSFVRIEIIRKRQKRCVCLNKIKPVGLCFFCTVLRFSLPVVTRFIPNSTGIRYGAKAQIKMTERSLPKVIERIAESP